MAESEDTEKTEEPSHQKLEKAHREGDVSKSTEVTSWFMLATMTLVLVVFSPPTAANLSALLVGFIERAHEISMDGESLRAILYSLGGGLAGVLFVPMGLFVLAGIAGNVLQHKPVFSAERMKPKFNKISPLAGAKRLFSAASLVNFTKGLFKLTIVTVAMVVVLWPERGRLYQSITLDPSAILPLVREMTVVVLGTVVAIMALVAVADFIFERQRWMKKQRMSIKELRDEHKNMEGDPAVRAKLRQIRVERGRKRMMANVPGATVVVTNPTHFAVALKYETGMAAPVCVAKGVDVLALKIRQLAEECDVPIIENPPLARALHRAVEVDDQIPPEHFRAVAEVIGYVLNLKVRSH
ncbi:MAG: flagellar biosynthesis protein FlhB [Alphaproteobacteria bacterium]